MKRKLQEKLKKKKWFTASFTFFFPLPSILYK